MSLFTYYAILLTVVYVLYYIVLIAMDKYGKPKDAEANVETMDTSDMVEKSEEENESKESENQAEAEDDGDETSRPMDDEEDNTPPYLSSGQEESHQEDEPDDNEVSPDSPSDAEIFDDEEPENIPEQENVPEQEQEDIPESDIVPEQETPSKDALDQLPEDQELESESEETAINDRIMQMYKERGITTFEESSEAEGLDLDVNDNEAHTVVHEPDTTLSQNAADIAHLHMEEIEIQSDEAELSSSFGKRLQNNSLNASSNIISHDEVLTP